MSEGIEYVQSRPRVTCDGCGRRSVGRIVTGRAWNENNRFQAALCAEGWQVWAGRNRRHRRHYCPNCNPKPGHKMSLVGGVPR